MMHHVPTVDRLTVSRSSSTKEVSYIISLM